MNVRLPRAGGTTAMVLAVALVGAAGLGGCVSVFPKSDPAQLYTFGRGATAAATTEAPAPLGDRVGVLLSGVSFPRAAQGDTILTMTGAEAAYIDQSRWVAPAVVLFREAVERRFEAGAKRTRIIARGDIGRTALMLRLDVRDFEAVYAAPGAIPEVVVVVHAQITRVDGAAVDERTFQVRRAAADNRVGAIVDGLDRATAEVLDGVVAWTDAAAAAPTPRSS